jgi:hypothetical protein
VFTVVRSIGSLKVSTIVLPTVMPLAPFEGLTVDTEGRVVFCVPDVPVVKVLVNVVSTFPA